MVPPALKKTPVIDRPPVTPDPSLSVHHPPQTSRSLGAVYVVAAVVVVAMLIVIGIGNGRRRKSETSTASLAAGQKEAEPFKPYLDAPALALVSKDEALSILKASNQWRSISWEPASTHGHEEPMFALAGMDGTLGQVSFEDDKVVAITLVLLPYRMPDPSLLSVLNLPKPTGTLQTFPLGMSWRDFKGRYKFVLIMGNQHCPGYAPTGGCTNLYVNFLRTD